MLILFKYLVSTLILGSSFGCVTLDKEKKPEKPPVIERSLTTEQVIDAGIKWGGKTLVDAKKHILVQKQWDKARPYLSGILKKNFRKWEDRELINAVHLYQASRPSDVPKIMSLLVSSENEMAMRLGWLLAAVLPSNAVKKEIDRLLSKAIAGNELDRQYYPQMAEALANNRMTESYTILRQGLMESHHVEFARAMMMLDRSRSSRDLMQYLAMAPPDELRQLSLSTVDILTCSEILNFLKNNPVDTGVPEFEHLYYFAISRNTALAQLGREVLEVYLPTQVNALAMRLARLPAWVQIAFVEGTRREMTPSMRLLLAELRQFTSQEDVVAEINNIKL